MTTPLAARLARIASTSTLRLTHYGRKTGNAFTVTIWFLVEDETIYLVTANRERAWPRNVLVRPHVKLEVGGERFDGRVEPIADAPTFEHVIDLMAAKYWYTRPYVWLAGLLGWQVASAAFRVRVAAT